MGFVTLGYNRDKGSTIRGFGHTINGTLKGADTTTLLISFLICQSALAEPSYYEFPEPSLRTRYKRADTKPLYPEFNPISTSHRPMRMWSVTPNDAESYIYSAGKNYKATIIGDITAKEKSEFLTEWNGMKFKAENHGGIIELKEALPPLPPGLAKVYGQ